MEPLVSVVILTYNHARLINRCLDGVLAQKVDFPMEVILADDCSTDGTRDICETYVANHPDSFRIVCGEKNVGAVENERRAFEAAKGKYIATCEGDDYWTDQDKLARQVGFLESNPDYSCCFHRFRKHIEATDSWESDGIDNLFVDVDAPSIELSMHQATHQWVTQYLTMVFRKSAYDFDAWKRYRYFRDTHQVYHLMKSGRCRLFAFDGGVYNMTGGGEYTTRSSYDRELMTLKVDTELWEVNRDPEWKDLCRIVRQDMIDNFAQEDLHKNELLGFCFRVFFADRKVKRFLRNIKAVLQNGGR